MLRTMDTTRSTAPELAEAKEEYAQHTLNKLYQLKATQYPSESLTARQNLSYRYDGNGNRLAFRDENWTYRTGTNLVDIDSGTKVFPRPQGQPRRTVHLPYHKRFIGGEYTTGGDQEFAIPNGPIPINAIIRVVEP